MLTALTAGLLLITISELGDKTFFIAVVMAMRHPQRRWIVFWGSWLALGLMTALSAGLGEVVNRLPEGWVRLGSVGLLLAFGIQMLLKAWMMVAKDGSEDCAREAAALVNKSGSGGTLAVFGQALSLTFMAEWGDRTQFATIALAAAQNPWGIIAGGTLGHGICTAIAVVGGCVLAKRISERAITWMGGGLFLLFAAITWWQS